MSFWEQVDAIATETLNHVPLRGEDGRPLPHAECRRAHSRNLEIIAKALMKAQETALWEARTALEFKNTQRHDELIRRQRN